MKRKNNLFSILLASLYIICIGGSTSLSAQSLLTYEKDTLPLPLPGMLVEGRDTLQFSDTTTDAHPSRIL